jgi:hypothetical protein
MRIHFRRPSAGVVLGFVALCVALGGTALAATGQLVNIADPGNASQVAKVDTAGSLQTRVSTGSVYATQASSRAFDFSRSVTNYNAGAGYQTLFSTTATLAITSLSVTNSIYNADPWELYLNYSPIPSGGQCAAFAAGYRVLAKVNVAAGGTQALPLPTPMLLKPAAAGASWCLMAGAAPRNGTSNAANGNDVRVNGVGFIVSGSFTAPPGAPAPSGPAGQTLGGADGG